jgi:multisubunit Na+/H+ antiporter MnhB subunit
MPQRLVARDDSPVSFLWIILVPVGLGLLALAGAGFYTLFDESFARSIAGVSSCNYHACSTSDIKTIGPIVGIVAGGAGLLLLGISLLPLLRNRRNRAARAAEPTGLAGLPGGFTPWTPPAPVTAPFAASAAAPATGGGDVAARLRSLDQLQATGSISDEEYSRRRAEILAAI